MWNYEKRLQYPVNITKPNAKIAQVIMSQYGGPDGEMGASMRYLSQRYATPNRKVVGILTDIGTEELVHIRWKSKAKNYAFDLISRIIGVSDQLLPTFKPLSFPLIQCQGCG